MDVVLLFVFWGNLNWRSLWLVQSLPPSALTTAECAHEFNDDPVFSVSMWLNKRHSSEPTFHELHAYLAQKLHALLLLSDDDLLNFSAWQSRKVW